VYFGQKHGRGKGANSMWRLIKFLFVLLVLAAIAFVGYAYLGPIFMPNDFAAPVQEIVVPVTLGGD
jgi:hypothetical protein